MDKIQKALAKLSEKERTAIKKALESLKSGAKNLDLAKLKGHDDIYRLRKSSLRIIFQMNAGEIRLLKIDRRGDTTYDEF